MGLRATLPNHIPACRSEFDQSTPSMRKGRDWGEMGKKTGGKNPDAECMLYKIMRFVKIKEIEKYANSKLFRGCLFRRFSK